MEARKWRIEAFDGGVCGRYGPGDIPEVTD